MVILGLNKEAQEWVQLTPQARQQGVYVVGTTGTGKTSLLRNIAYQDMIDPLKPALIVLDPHGDFTNELLTLVPPSRQNDVVVFEPGNWQQQDTPLGLNLLACDRTSSLEKRLVTATVVNTLRKLFSYSWGPRMEDLLRVSLLSLMETDNTTLLDLLLILASYRHRQYYRKNITDPVLRHYWEQQFPECYEDKYGNLKTPKEQTEIVGSSLNKIGRFLVDPVLRNVVSQPKNSFNIREIMDTGKILLINLSKGLLGEDNSSLLGAVIINLILVAALRRADMLPSERRPVHLIVDEYQTFATESFPTLQSEARKYNIDLIVAHQYRDQLDQLNRGSTLNVANFIVMRVSGIDSTELAMQFDNTPPEPEVKMEPVYVNEGSLPNGDATYIPRQLASGKGTLHHEVEQPRRLYTDVAAERANGLATLPNHEGTCRLVNESGRLVEYTFQSVPLSRIYPTVQAIGGIAAHIRGQSMNLGTPRKKVEADIKKKMGKIEFYEVVSETPTPLVETADDTPHEGTQ